MTKLTRRQARLVLIALALSLALYALGVWLIYAIPHHAGQGAMMRFFMGLAFSAFIVYVILPVGIALFGALVRLLFDELHGLIKTATNKTAPVAPAPQTPVKKTASKRKPKAPVLISPPPLGERSRKSLLASDK